MERIITIIVLFFFCREEEMLFIIDNGIHVPVNIASELYTYIFYVHR